MRALPTGIIGNTGLSVPAIGFGAAPIGNLYRQMSDAEAAGVVTAALEAGFRYFDTAPHYGFGLSERRLGASLRDHALTDRIVLSTKVGRRLEPVAPGTSGERHGFVNADPFEPVFDYSYDAVMRSFEESCRRLGRTHIDILFAHDLGEMTHGAAHEDHYRTFCEGGYRAMDELRAAGQVTAIGIGANEWQIGLQAFTDTDLDCFLLAGRYTLLEQGALEAFLPEALHRNVSVIIGGPFNSGILAGDLGDEQALHYNYGKAPPAIIGRARALHAACARYDVDLKSAALQFPLAHPAVTGIIPGLARKAEIDQAVTGITSRIDANLWQDLKIAGLISPDAPSPVQALAPAQEAT